MQITSVLFKAIINLNGYLNSIEIFELLRGKTFRVVNLLFCLKDSAIEEGTVILDACVCWSYTYCQLKWQNLSAAV